MNIKALVSIATFLMVGTAPALAVQGSGLDLATPGFDPAATAAELGGFGPKIQALSEENARRQPASTDPVAAALAFIDAHSPFFGIGGGERILTGQPPSRTLRLSRRVDSRNRTHLTFEQTLAGLPIVGNAVLVHVDATNRTREFSGGLVPGSALVQDEFSVTEAQAIAAARTHLAPAGLRGEIAAERAWLPTTGGLVSVYLVKIPATSPLGDWTVYVDAKNGAVRAVDDAMCHLTPTAKAYRDHPMNSEIETYELKDLGGDGTRLAGPFVKVINADADGAVAADGKFHYGPDDTHFDEAMVYTHLELIHRFYKQTLNFHKMDWVMKATVHYGDAYDNAFFSPMGKELAFGDGNKLNDLSKEAGVVYHEYTHAVSGEMASMRWGEGGAMNEGYSDYIACTLDNDHLMGEYAVAKLGRPYMRNLESTKHYPEDWDGEVHADGEIWAAACWDLRKALGREVADVLVHESRNYLGWWPKFVKGAAGAIKADQALFQGQHVAQIVQLFNARGIKVSAEEAGRSLTRQRNFEALTR